MNSGNLFTLGNRVYRLDWAWAKMPKQLLGSPVAGVFAGFGGLVAITRNHAHPIIRFDMDGNYVGSLGAELDFSGEHGLFVTEDGRIWVCDADRHAAYALDVRGNILQTLGTPDAPCDNGYQKDVPYPHNLYTIREAGAPFNRPTRAVQAKNGDIYCCDGYGNAAVHQFSGDGRLIRTWGGPGKGAGQFTLPHSIWVDPRGNVWVADRDNYRVQVFAKDGVLIRCFDPIFPEDTPFGPMDIWGDGEWVFVVQNSRGILAFDLTTEPLGMMEAPAMSPIHGHSLCGDAQGNLYIGHLHGYPISRLERIS